MAGDFPFDVFLSHNRADKPRVRRLAERLKGAGLRVWLDEWVIQPGDIISLKVDEGLEQSRVLLLCLSPAALASDWVALERSTAIHRDPANAGRRFIPLLLADCKLPDTLRRYKYVDFREETEAAFAELLTAFAGMPFAKLQGLPQDARPVSLWGNRDEAWLDVAKGIPRVVEEIRANVGVHQPQIPHASNLVPFRVPLSLVRGANEFATAFAVVSGEEQLRSHLAGPRARLVIYGESGAGKTQLLLSFEKSFRDQGWSVAFIEPQHRSLGSLPIQLGQQLGERHASDHAAASRVVIFVDGLDEIRPDERDALVTEVDNWVARGASALIATRTLASMPERFRHAEDGYTPYALRQLSVEEREAIVQSWSAQYERRAGETAILEVGKSSPSRLSMPLLMSTDFVLRTPLFVVACCEFKAAKGHDPKWRHEVIEFLVEHQLKPIHEPHLAAAQRLLFRLAERANHNAPVVSVPLLSRATVELETAALTRELGIDHIPAKELLLRTQLLVAEDNCVCFGIHGVVFHYLLAKSLVMSQQVFAQHLVDAQRETVEFVASLSAATDAVRLASDLLEEAERRHPTDRVVAETDDPTDPALPYIALAALDPFAVTSDVLDRLVRSALDRCAVRDGPTRWIAIWMLARIGRHLPQSQALFAPDYLARPEIAADVAEVLCWVGHDEPKLRTWVLDRLAFLADITTESHPLMHILEGLARLGLESSHSATLKRLSADAHPVIAFTASSLLSQHRATWLVSGTKLIQWWKAPKRREENDYYVVHGLYPLRWFVHSQFGEHPQADDARDIIFDFIKAIPSGTPGSSSRERWPHYWLWYLQHPIECLGVATSCRTLLQQVMAPGLPKQPMDFCLEFMNTITNH